MQKLMNAVREMLGRPPRNTAQYPYATDGYYLEMERKERWRFKKALDSFIKQATYFEYHIRMIEYQRKRAVGLDEAKPELPETALLPGTGFGQWMRARERAISHIATAETGQQVLERLQYWSLHYAEDAGLDCSRTIPIVDKFDR